MKEYPDLLNQQERRDLLKEAEWLLDDLLKNQLGGFSDENRPFFILDKFKDIIERFGKRDVGCRWSRDEIEAHPDHNTTS